MEKSDLKVWYGFRKLTKKLVKKKELFVVFENSNSRNDRKMKHILNHHIVYERFQTIKESEAAKGSCREFTTYSTFIDLKPYFGDIDKVLENNFKADENHVSEEERIIIREKLKEYYKRHYENQS